MGGQIRSGNLRDNRGIRHSVFTQETSPMPHETVPNLEVELKAYSVPMGPWFIVQEKSLPRGAAVLALS